MAKVAEMGRNFGPMIQQMSGLMGAPSNQGDMFEKLESMRTVIKEVNDQFKNPDLTTFGKLI